MFQISDIRVGSVIEINNSPHKVTKAEHHKMGRGGAVLRLNAKNLLNGSAISKTLQGNEKIQEADVARSKAQFLFQDGTDAHFMDQGTFEQFTFPLKELHSQINFLIEGNDVDIQLWNGNPVTVELPPNLIFQVTESPEGAKGDTANAPTKTATLETGFELQVPLFIKPGDKVKVDTRTSQYLERAN